ncbi:hypothetical protein [Paenibacillus sp. TSA_86.1]
MLGMLSIWNKEGLSCGYPSVIDYDQSSMAIRAALIRVLAYL